MPPPKTTLIPFLAINFATSFANTNYCAVATSGHQISPIGSEANNAAGYNDTTAVEVRVLTTSNMYVVTEDSSQSGYHDRDKLMIAIFSA